MAPTAVELMTLAVRATAADPGSNTNNANLSTSEAEALARVNRWGPYGYQPALAGGIVFCIVYGLLAIVLTFQGIRGRRWWMLATLAFGAFAECVGNGVRIYGHFHPRVINPYIAQQVILVLTPAFFAAAHFTIITKICEVYGEKYLRPLRAKWLIPFFVSLDVASLAVQGAGSGYAAVSETNGDAVKTINGYGNVVVAGLAIQLAAYVFFNIIFVTVVLRAHREQRDNTTWLTRRMKIFLAATWVSALFVLGRSAFRTAEMAIGWIGRVATVEWYYLVFDATFVAVALIFLAVFSPADHMPRVDGMDQKGSRVQSGVAGSEKGTYTEGDGDAAMSTMTAHEQDNVSPSSSTPFHKHHASTASSQPATLHEYEGVDSTGVKGSP